MRPAAAPTRSARIVAKRVSETIGQPIVVENRGGAGSIIGTEDVHKADPDGYTLLLGQSGPISINPGGLQGTALRSGKGFRADHHDHGLSLHSRGQCQAAGEDPAGLRRHGESQARRIQLRHHRRRRRQSSRHRIVLEQGRIEDDACALSRHRARGRRSSGRTGDDGVRRSGFGAAASASRARCARWR